MTADDLVRDFIFRRYREDNPHSHIAECEEAGVYACDSSDGSYGCETGCEYVRFEAVIGCPHEEEVAYEYGSFGELWMIIEDIKDNLA